MKFCFLFSPNSALGKFSHYPKVSYICEATSEIYFLAMIMIYPYVTTTSNSYLAYNIVLAVITLAKMNKEVQELFRRKWHSYIDDLYNWLDWLEISMLIIVVIFGVFYKSNYQDSFGGSILQTEPHKT